MLLRQKTKDNVPLPSPLQDQTAPMHATITQENTASMKTESQYTSEQAETWGCRAMGSHAMHQRAMCHKTTATCRTEVLADKETQRTPTPRFHREHVGQRAGAQFYTLLSYTQRIAEQLQTHQVAPGSANIARERCSPCGCFVGRSSQQRALRAIQKSSVFQSKAAQRARHGLDVATQVSIVKFRIVIRPMWEHRLLDKATLCIKSDIV